MALNSDVEFSFVSQCMYIQSYFYYNVTHVTIIKDHFLLIQALSVCYIINKDLIILSATIFRWHFTVHSRYLGSVTMNIFRKNIFFLNHL